MNGHPIRAPWALSVHGDLEGESDRRNLPPGRHRRCVPNCLRGKVNGSKAYQLIRQQVGPEVCGLMWSWHPLVEGIGNPGPALSGWRFTTSSAARLADLRVGLLAWPRGQTTDKQAADHRLGWRRHRCAVSTTVWKWAWMCPRPA